MWIEVAAIVGLALTNVVCYICHDQSIIRRSFDWPKLFFVSNKASSSTNAFPSEYWAFDILDPAHLVSSDFLNDVGILLLRSLSFAFFIVTLLLEGLTGDGFGRPLGWFTFFTNWTFLLFGIWSCYGLGITAWNLQAKINQLGAKFPSEEEEQLTHREQEQAVGASTPLQSVLKWNHWTVTYLLMTQTVATSTLFLSAFYWILIYNPKYHIEVDNLLKHGVNNVILLLEVCLCRIPFVSFHFQVVILYGSVYTIFMWIYHAASLHWVYWILDWSQPTALLLYLLNPLFVYLAFGFWYGVACLRERLGLKYSSRDRMGSLQQISTQQSL